MPTSPHSGFSHADNTGLLRSPAGLFHAFAALLKLMHNLRRNTASTGYKLEILFHLGARPEFRARTAEQLL
jgi:hypothetical protein